MAAKIKRPYHTRLLVEQDSLMSLVETHDVAGLLTALDTKDGPAFSMPLCPPSSKYSTREYLTKNKSAVERACELGHLDILNLFLINGCSPNLPTSHGRLVHTVLATLKSQRHLIDNGRALVSLKLMLARNCDINVQSFDRKSVLMQACELADPAILQLLLRKSSQWQLNFCDCGRSPSPLHMACMKSSIRCVRLLLRRLSRHETNTKFNTLTPLLTTLTLIRHNMTYNPRPPGFDTALNLAQHRLIAIVEMLLQSGADANAGSARDSKEFSWFEGKFNAVCCALDLAEECSKEDEGESSSLAGNSIKDMYYSLVRLLAHWGARIPAEIPASVCSERFPHMQSLLDELNELNSVRQLSKSDSTHDCANVVKSPLSLLELCRRNIRLHSARCDRLAYLENVPLPRKLKDYTRFLTF